MAVETRLLVGCQNDSVEVLRRWFEQLRLQAADLVKQLAPAPAQQHALADRQVTVEAVLIAIPRTTREEKVASKAVV